MSIQAPFSVGKVQKTFQFGAIFRALAPGCTKLTLAIVDLAEMRTMHGYLAAAEAAGRKSNDAVSQLVSRFNQEGLVAYGIMPLYTPLGASWLNMTESLQGVLARRALAGQHPQSPADIIHWLEAVARHWNQAPTPHAK